MKKSYAKHQLNNTKCLQSFITNNNLFIFQPFQIMYENLHVVNITTVIFCSKSIMRRFMLVPCKYIISSLLAFYSIIITCLNSLDKLEKNHVIKKILSLFINRDRILKLHLDDISRTNCEVRWDYFFSYRVANLMRNFSLITERSHSFRAHI